MKKLISFLIVFAVLLSFCACSADQQTEPSQESTGASTAPTVSAEEDPFAHINELEPNEKGVYQICSSVGLMNMINHPDSDFELLCDIDLEGADWVPVGTQAVPFTGRLNGQYFTISNFTITKPTADGDMGFFGVNAGDVMNLYVKDVTITTTEDTVRVGAVAGTNSGNIRRCEFRGTMNAEKLAAGADCGSAVGVNTKLLESTVCGVDVSCTAAVAANVGGAVGSQQGGKLQYCEMAGKLEVTGGETKKVGLFAGNASGAALEENLFTGAANAVDGQSYTACFGAVDETTTNEIYSIRDNSAVAEALPEDAMERRRKVVELAYEMSTTEWTVTQPLALNYTCTCCTDITFLPTKTYRGIPYNHKNGSMQRFYYCAEQGENGKYVISDWVYDHEGFDSWDMYIGNDCSSAVQQIYATVSNNCEFFRSLTQFPIYAETYEANEAFPMTGNGCIPVGDWVWDIPLDEDHYMATTEAYITATGVDKMYECYAQMRAGDLIGNVVSAGGHCQIVVENPVVMLDEEGNLDPDASYVLTIQQVASFQEFEGYTSSWRVESKYSFKELLDLWYVPMTFPELIYGSDEVPQATVENTLEGRLGLTTGVVTSNYYMDSVEMVITDDSGSEVFRKNMFVTVDKSGDSGSEYWNIRVLPREFDLAHFTAPLSQVQWDTQKTYHCTVTVHLTCGESVQATEFDF